MKTTQKVTQISLQEKLAEYAFVTICEFEFKKITEKEFNHRMNLIQEFSKKPSMVKVKVRGV